MWAQLNREGAEVARCTVERLVREAGLVGVRRDRRIRTTNAGARAPGGGFSRAPVRPAAPDRLPVADFSYVPTQARDGLRRVRHRRVLATDPGLARRHLDAHRDCARRTRASGMDPRTGKPRRPAWADRPLRRRVSTPVHRPTPNAAPRLERRPRSGRSATPTTTPWPSPRSSCSRPN